MYIAAVLLSNHVCENWLYLTTRRHLSPASGSERYNRDPDQQSGNHEDVNDVNDTEEQRAHRWQSKGLVLFEGIILLLAHQTFQLAFVRHLDLGEPTLSLRSLVYCARLISQHIVGLCDLARDR